VFDLACYCQNEGCGHQWSVTLRLTISVDMIDTSALANDVIIDTTASIIDATQIT
jgi:hypothetical protein